MGRGPEGCRGPLQHRARAGLGPGRQLCDRAQHLTSLRLGDSSFLREDSGPISQGCGEGHGRLGGQHHAAQSTSRDLTEHLLCDRLCPRSGVQWPVAPVQPTMGGLQPTGEKGSRGPATWLSAERGQEPAAPCSAAHQLRLVGQVTSPPRFSVPDSKQGQEEGRGPDRTVRSEGSSLSNFTQHPVHGKAKY